MNIAVRTLPTIEEKAYVNKATLLHVPLTHFVRRRYLLTLYGFTIDGAIRKGD